MFLALCHSLKQMPQGLDDGNTRAAGPSRVQDDGAAEGRVIFGDGGGKSSDGDGDPLCIIGVLPV